MTVFPAAPARAEEGGENLNAEIDARRRAAYELRQKIQQYNELAQQHPLQTRYLRTRLADLRKNSELARQQLSLMEARLDNLQKSIASLDERMASAAAQTETLTDELEKRLLNIHKYGRREELNLLLAAESANEAMASAYLLERLARFDRLSIERLAAGISALRQGRRGMESSRAMMTAWVREMNARREEYGAAINRTSGALAAVQKESVETGAAIEKTEQARREIERAIAGLVRRKNELPSQVPLPLSSNERGAYQTLEMGAKLDWPVGVNGGDVNFQRAGSGININAPQGAAVLAAGPGEVLYEGWLRDFGQVVIIGHGRDISTVYANLAFTRVRTGDPVMPGMVIGSLESGGVAGRVLYFEVRAGDAAKNPLDYLKKNLKK